MMGWENLVSIEYNLHPHRTKSYLVSSKMRIKVDSLYGLIHI